MSHQVYWTETAIQHLQAVYDYIAQTSPVYAQRIVDRLTKRSQQIMQFPYSGRMVPEYEADNIREVREGSYRLIYRILPKQIDVLAIIHEAREL
ncbi:MAG: type II toxin-antitoxin system RelE/ParE family toxin [Chloroflexi bacterium]|nr:type II toxin-antitoxin system RelE/ParE family toxin [Chloroflexota bacterium]